ncbi:unnamed protein product [Durusdinium trenchii]|uniref:Uncharacterized protein n=2 Tax=Durusdinium trenchii TaxID=1381693 RepID=A0ABP0II63_9DINO
MAATYSYEDLEMHSGSDHEEERDNRPRWSTTWRVAGLVGSLALVATVLALLPASGPFLEGSLGGVVQKNNDWVMTGVFTPMSLPASVATNAALKPEENRQDGNVCADDEEKFEGICYKKCSILTQGTHKIRTTAFTCCSADKIEDCGFSNQEVKMSICGGFDVAGDINGQEGLCPHKKGSCYLNEEMYLGMCYKKCSDLTDGAYTHRISAFSCCNNENILACNPFSFGTSNVKSAVSFNAGGKLDSSPHNPVPELTESSSPATPNGAAPAAPAAAPAPAVA